MTISINGTNGLIQAYDYQVLTTAFSYTFAAGTQVLVINPAGTLATGTITMPAAPSDGMTITFSSTKQITALTMAGNGATLVSAVTALNANQSVSYIYRATGTSWYPYTTQVAQNTGPAFSAFRTGSAQVISASTWTKVQLDTENFDTNNCFDSTTNYRFTPTTAGYYQVNFSVFGGAGSNTGIQAAVYKNGVQYLISSNTATSAVLDDWSASGSVLLSMNGSTDYIEMFAFMVGTASIGIAVYTHMDAFLARNA